MALPPLLPLPSLFRGNDVIPARIKGEVAARGGSQIYLYNYTVKTKSTTNASFILRLKSGTFNCTAFYESFSKEHHILFFTVGQNETLVCAGVP